MTTGLGLVGETPPEAVATEGTPTLLARVPAGYRDEAIEVAHWAFGAVAGGAFAALPRSLRRTAWAGPAYGLGIWLLFEAVLAPALLGVERAKERSLTERLWIAVDHVLYGAVLAASPSSSTTKPRSRSIRTR